MCASYSSFDNIHIYTNIVKILIKFNANVNLQDEDGCTALMHASYSYYKNIPLLLIKSGANVNLQNNDNDTAFIVAFSNECKNTILLLLRYNINTRLNNKPNFNIKQLIKYDKRFNML
jgi:ankyrin repeat protein